MLHPDPDEVSLRRTLSAAGLEGAAAEADPAEPGSDQRLVLCFHVTDTGIGIKPEHQERIFEMFEQGEYALSRQFGGTGLGLAISRRLAALLGGRIWLESAPGVGSRFSFTALVEPAAKLPGDPVLIAPPVPAGGGVGAVLVVEDDPFNRKLLEIGRASCRERV